MTFFVVVIGAAALFIVLSGFSGLKEFSLSFSNSFDPALKSVDPNSADYFKLEVPDPYNQSDEAYETTLAMVERAVDGLLAELVS